MKTNGTQLIGHSEFFTFQNFNLQTLVVNSEALKGNALGDPHVRRNPVLVPKIAAPVEGWPVVFVLAGFTGNGPNYFNTKTFELNLPQTLDRAVSVGEGPLAIYVFCEAMTYWGGSQFVNSPATGRYEDYVAHEIVAAVRAELPASKLSSHWCVMGGSSGGYGSLHLASRHADTFSVCAAIAPDSFFSASLLPEVYSALPTLEKLGGVSGVKAELESGKLTKRKDSHTILNAVAMGLCYGPGPDPEFPVPVDRLTGVVIPEVWREFESHDPIIFLRHREKELRKLKRVFLDVGTRDQFHLQFGSRQIRDVLRAFDIPLDYSEFDGTHFDIGDRRPLVWKWLKEMWDVSTTK